MRPCRSALFVLAVLATAAACASSGNSIPHDRPPVSLIVENHFAENVRVYLRRGATAILLGRVATLERRTFTLAPSMLPPHADVQVHIRPARGTGHTTAPVLVESGDRVFLRVTFRLAGSELTLRH